MEVKKTINNFMGTILGFQECMLCGDRENWKSFIIVNFDEKTSDKIKDYTPPICDDCFRSNPIAETIHCVKKDITEINNFTRKIRYSPYYTDSEIDKILSSIRSTREAIE